MNARWSPGVRYMALAAFWFSVMSVFVKLAGARLPSQEVVLARGVVTLALSYYALRRAGVSPWGTRRGWLIARGLAGFVALSCYYYAVTHLPLPEATVLQYLNPVFTALLAAVTLRGEQLSVRDFALTALSFVGVVLVARPSYLLGGAASLDVGAVTIAIVGALFSAVAYVLVRGLRATEHPLVVVFYFALVAVPATVPTVIFDLVMPTGIEWFWLLGVGVATQLAQVSMTRGLHLESAARATSISYLQVVFAGIFGAVLFGEYPTWVSLVGTGIILIATYGVASRTSVQSVAVRPPDAPLP